MSSTAAQLLAQTEAAIFNCLTAQSYTAYGRQKNMAELDQLRKFRAELQQEMRDDADNFGMGSSGSMAQLISLEPPQ
jgi:hypothetical protein